MIFFVTFHEEEKKIAFLISQEETEKFTSSTEEKLCVYLGEKDE